MRETDTRERNAQILELRRNGATLQQIADTHGLTRETVRRIVNAVLPPRKHGRPCPFCGANSRLLWVRDQPDGTTRRRRECLSPTCRQRWNRVEKDDQIVCRLPAIAHSK